MQNEASYYRCEFILCNKTHFVYLVGKKLLNIPRFCDLNNILPTHTLKWGQPPLPFIHSTNNSWAQLSGMGIQGEPSPHSHGAQVIVGCDCHLRGLLDLPWEGHVYVHEATRVQYNGIHRHMPSDVCNSRCCVIPWKAKPR